MVQLHIIFKNFYFNYRGVGQMVRSEITALTYFLCSFHTQIVWLSICWKAELWHGCVGRLCCNVVCNVLRMFSECSTVLI